MHPPDSILETVLYARDLAAVERFYCRRSSGLKCANHLVPDRFVFLRLRAARCCWSSTPTIQGKTTRRSAFPRHGTDGQGHVCFRAGDDEAEIAAWRNHLPRQGQLPSSMSTGWDERRAIALCPRSGGKLGRDRRRGALGAGLGATCKRAVPNGLPFFAADQRLMSPVSCRSLAPDGLAGDRARRRRGRCPGPAPHPAASAQSRPASPVARLVAGGSHQLFNHGQHGLSFRHVGRLVLSRVQDVGIMVAQTTPRSCRCRHAHDAWLDRFLMATSARLRDHLCRAAGDAGDPQRFRRETVQRRGKRREVDLDAALLGAVLHRRGSVRVAAHQRQEGRLRPASAACNG